ncbi:exosome complex protein Rrp42 [Candidatus Woesearchaeota archaeon]|nr:exosome complex protein Rrp42 [Candidatus Woesearchaeota archaeon]
MNETQKTHILRALNKNIRFDGRTLTEFRDVSVERGVSETAEGSARVKIGETEVIAGVKLAIGTPYPDTPNEGGLAVGVELLPLSSPRFELGPPGIEAVELARVADRGVREAKAIDIKKLCITPGEKVWIVSIDICTINDAGNLMDACALASIAALQDTRFPKYDGTELDYRTRTDKKLPLTKLPISVTVHKIGSAFLVDPLPEEEEAAEARLTVATTPDGTLCAMQKGGDTPLKFEEVNAMIDIAMEKAKELRKHI